jgi:hypothetical protein
MSELFVVVVVVVESSKVPKNRGGSRENLRGSFPNESIR